MQSATAPLSELSIARAAELIEAQALSPVALVEACLERIGEIDATINSYITVCADAARSAAKAAEERARAKNRWSPLDGIPIALKDIIATRGVRTTAGSRILADYVPEHDAACVGALERAGAVILGKNNAHEFAYGVTSDNPHFGPVRNPCAYERIPGGSSGGSAAAVAAGLAAAAIGSDTGGSIRIPAACCGIVGLKPTYDLISRAGVIPQAWSLDHIGPLTRTVADAGLVLDALAGQTISRRAPSVGDTGDLPLRDVRLGVPWDLANAAEARVREAFEGALATLGELGAKVRDLALPNVERARLAWLTIVLAETAAYHRRHLREAASRIGADVRPYLMAGALVAADRYLDAQRWRRHWADEIDAATSAIDVVVTPTLPTVAPEVGQAEVATGQGSMAVRDAMVFYQWPANLLGWPSISVPCAQRIDGLPVGLMLTGRPWTEASLLAIAAAFEASAQGHG